MAAFYQSRWNCCLGGWCETSAGREPHRKDLAKSELGYPASLSTQCGQGAQTGKAPPQVQGKYVRGLAVSFWNQLIQAQWQQFNVD